MKNIILILIFSFIIAEKLPNEVRWVKNSDEYKSTCYQTYRYAKQNLEAHIQPNQFSLNKQDNSNLAVIMDLDETVLDNSQYQVELFEKNETFNMESWAVWVRRAEAELVPGSKDFIDLVRENNIQLIFISNRMDERLQETILNMEKLGVHADNDIYLLRKNRADKKNIRRNEVYTSTGRMSAYKNFTVIQYLGDAMGDFPDKSSKEFGDSQFVFPNPMYGKW